jgi:hypothetical protein
MKVVVFDWAQGKLLEGTGYSHNQEIEGTKEEAARIASEIFLKGPNVMMLHRGGQNRGTRKKPDIEPNWILIQTDDQNFKMR